MYSDDSLNDIRFRSYETYEKLMGKKFLKKIGYNTYVQKRETLFGKSGYVFEILFHASIIARIYPDSIAFYNRGFKTRTTKERIDSLLPPNWVLFQHKKEWYFTNRDSAKNTSEIWYDWYEGCTFHFENKIWTLL